MAHAHRIVQVPNLRRKPDTDSNAYTYSDRDSDADSYAYADTNTDANSYAGAGAKCAKQSKRNGDVYNSDQSVVDGQFK